MFTVNVELCRGHLPAFMRLVFRGDALTISVTLRKETPGLGSEEGHEPVAGTVAAGMVGVSSQIDKEPKTAGKKMSDKNLIIKSPHSLNTSVMCYMCICVVRKSWCC